eukprot:GEMP01067024.1.p1 GENE.GEMP01067024.1~~GEMP01067024.1.p1  ORF type:complete len:403 (+),score=70.24 GEMP01067024.1:73-1281(+)
MYKKYIMRVYITLHALSVVRSVPFGTDGRIDVTVGEPPQNMKVLLDMSSSSWWLARKGDNHPSGYGAEISTSSQVTHETRPWASLPNVHVQGVKASDTMRIGRNHMNTDFLLAENVTGTSADGILGLGPDSKLLSWTLSKDEFRIGEDTAAQSWTPIGLPTIPQIVGERMDGVGPLWASQVRGVGIGSSAIDFNALDFKFGIPAQIDPTKETALRFDATLFRALRIESILSAAAGAPCARNDNDQLLTCPCNDLSAFPPIAISIEPVGNFHLFGIDAGAETLLCIPPEAYMTKAKEGKCTVLIASDPEGRFLLGRALLVGSSIMKKDGLLYISQSPASCESPLSTFFTGERFSLPRCMVVLASVGILCFFVMRPGRQWRNAYTVRDVDALPLNPRGMDAEEI